MEPQAARRKGGCGQCLETVAGAWDQQLERLSPCFGGHFPKFGSRFHEVQM